VCCSVLQCVAVCCSELQCVMSGNRVNVVLQRVAVCCCVFAVCCSVLQCVEKESVLQSAMSGDRVSVAVC